MCALYVTLVMLTCSRSHAVSRAVSLLTEELDWAQLFLHPLSNLYTPQNTISIPLFNYFYAPLPSLATLNCY